MFLNKTGVTPGARDMICGQGVAERLSALVLGLRVLPLALERGWAWPAPDIAARV